MDDMLIYLETEELDQIHMERVLQRLEENDLYLKFQKCMFNAKKIEYLRLIIFPKKIAMDPAKLAGIADWPVFFMVKQVRSFLGFVNFYQ